MQRAAGKQLVVHSPTQACRGSFGPAITLTLSHDASGHKGLLRPGACVDRLSRQAGADLAVVTADADLHMASGLPSWGKFDGVFGLIVLRQKVSVLQRREKCAGGYDEGTCLCADSCRVVTW
jgi:hypothetical protein